MSIFAKPDAGPDTLISTRPAPVTAGAKPVLRIPPRYEVVGYLGRGGMGAVYRAIDRELNDVVALKVVRSDHAHGIAMVREEARLARRVSHRNVVRIHDIGEFEGERFITMECIEGESLGAYSARNAPLDLRDVVRIGRAICLGLAAIHDAGIVHRDLKPANVLIDAGGRVAISDFGVAQPMSGSPISSGAGTIAYMAPEQFDEAVVDQRADIYSVGAILYELATGRRAWEGTAAEVVGRKMSELAPDPRSVAPLVDTALATLVTRCLSRQRGERPASASEVEKALAGLVPAGSVLAPMHVRPHGADKHVAVVLSNEAGPEQEYFATGIAMDLADAIRAIAGVVTRPLTQVRAAALSAPNDALAIGRALGIDVVIEGLVQGSADALAVSMRVVVVDDGVCLWSERFEPAGLRAAEIVTNSADAVSHALAARERARSNSHPPPRAHDLFMRGRYLADRPWHEALDQAVVILGEAHAAVPDDPRIAATYALTLARHYGVRSQSVEACERARRIARRSLELDPSGTANVALALTHWFSGEGVAASSELRLALEKDPMNVHALTWTGLILVEVGEHSAGLAILERVEALEPDRGHLRRARARIAAQRGDFRTALTELDRAPMASVDTPMDAFLKGRILLWQLDPADARRALEASATLDLSADTRVGYEFFLRLCIERTIGEDWHPKIEERLPVTASPRQAALHAQVRAEAYAAAHLDGRVLEMFSALEDSYFVDGSWLEHCPLLQPYRAKPEYVRLMGKARRRSEPIRELLAPVVESSTVQRRGS